MQREEIVTVVVTVVVHWKLYSLSVKKKSLANVYTIDPWGRGDVVRVHRVAGTEGEEREKEGGNTVGTSNTFFC